MVTTYAVGKPYNANVRSWPDGTAQLRLSPLGCELVLFFGQPTDREVDAVRRGEARFGLVSTERVLIWLYRFGDGVPWSDTPWEAGRQTDAPVGITGDLGDGLHLLMSVVLVDSANGLVRVLRQVTLPPRMIDALRQAIAEQQRAGYDAQAAGRTLQDLYARYPSTTALLEQRAELTCKGGH